MGFWSMGRGVAPTLLEGEVCLGSVLVGIWGVGALLQKRDKCLVSPCHCPRLGVTIPCLLLMPTVALKVSSVLHGGIDAIFSS